MNTRRDKIKDIDYKLLLTLIAVVGFGLIVLNSATLSLTNGSRIMYAQKIATAIGFVGLLVLSIIDYRHWKYLYKIIYALSIILLVITLVIGKGPGGVRSWVYIGSFGFQPSEFVKVALIISLAAYLEEVHEDINKPIVLLKVLAFAFLPVVLILRQPDTGTAIVYMFIIMFMLFLAGISWKYILLAAGIAIVIAPIIWLNLKPHQKNRFLDFFNPASDPSGTGYQYIQGEIAIGSGQILGKGLNKGTQTQFGFIPEKQNDFIFPVLVEELGFVGGFSLLVIYLFMLFRLYKISKTSVDLFGSYMVIGIAALFLFHIWENIGMTLGVMPITGIPLPFFSSGGTFQLTSLALMGLCLSVSAHKNIKYF